jgi:hypothetical protein
MGHYDAVGIVELPNDEARAKIALTNASRGTVRSETLRAFTEEEYPLRVWDHAGTAEAHRLARESHATVFESTLKTRSLLRPRRGPAL